MADILATCSGGIIFTGESVRTIRELRKTRTTRVIKPQPSAGVRSSPFVPSGIEDGHGRQFRPRYQPGKRYYVKETWCCKVDMISAKVTDDFYYRLDNPDVVKVDGDGWTVANKDGAEASPWLSPMRMPKRAARYVIEIDEVKVMRLQDITEKEVQEEGIYTWAEGDHTCNTVETYFAPAWNQINGKTAPWFTNPWVFSHRFHLVTP